MARLNPELHAKEIVNGDREAVYGAPMDHFTATGRMWGALLQAHFGIPIPDIPAEVIALMFIADNEVRLCHTLTYEDGPVDIHGYANCFTRIVNER